MLPLNKLQIVYQPEDENPDEIHWLWKEEAEAMRAAGIGVGASPDPDAARLLFRGSMPLVEENYRGEERFVNRYKAFVDCAKLSCYYTLIEELTIETFFTDQLDTTAISKIQALGWARAFVKNDVKSLEFIEEGKSVWPDTSFEEMNERFAQMGKTEKYAIRKFVDFNFLKDEERYWVFNGNVYHRENNVPNIVQEAANRLNALGSKYYTIDATPDLVIEVNPGESSDRHAVNSAALFASWVKKEFGT